MKLSSVFMGPPNPQCLKVLLSGVCSHTDNEHNKMHVCNLSGPHAFHKCVCGKEWDEVQCSSSI